MRRIGNLSYEDSYRDIPVHCTLPHDYALDKPDELAKLSGPVITYKTKKITEGGRESDESQG